ncbi:MAG TPA: alcohol dehydrogenase catalytic domain-containing protein [Frankiaceae bacterium]|nr:alcohol dehydrogenase catalytic domain-containing protein [Frankiaceae bacterium]
MRAVVYRGERDVRVEDVPAPALVEPDDVIVKVSKTAICGSDLHFYHGRLPGLFEGSTVGHEFVGTVVSTGADVARFREGDEVVGSFQIACGACAACRAGRFNHCDDLAVLGYGVFVGDLGGAQAEYVRIPHGDVNLMAIPAGLDPERALFTGDILTTAWYAAGIAPVTEGDDVVVVGAGPVGLFSVLAARALGAGRVIAVDMVPSRLALATELGAVGINGNERSPTVAVEETFGRMADVVIETVGMPPALLTATECVRPGGTVSVIGVHNEFEFPLPLGTLFRNSVTLRFGGPCNVQGWWERALDAVVSGSVDPTAIISHRMPLEEAAEGYRLFDAKEASKVVLEVS